MDRNRQKIAIFGSRRQSSHLEGLQRLLNFLEGKGFYVYVHEDFYNYLNKEGVSTGGSIPVMHLPPDVRMVIGLGGDGTMLRTARWVAEKGTPIFGVNTGHLGYLSACTLDDFKDTFEKALEGEIQVQERMLLEVKCQSLPSGEWPYALNEVTLRRDERASVISIKASLGEYALADYIADGLIVSTPTGSTAYNLSAGGPILEPTVGCVAVTPIAPHTLTLRPLVISDTSALVLKGETRSGRYRLSLDDRSYTLVSGEKVTIKKAPFSVKLVRRLNDNFAGILQEKLLWNASARSN